MIPIIPSVGMVRVIGHNDHLSKIARKYRNRLILALMLYPPALALALLYPQIIPAVAIGLALITAKLVKLSSKYIKYKKGIKGEIKVEKALSKLDNSYILINNVRLPNRNGNIDHVVVGPTGVFAIETKNIRGNFICEGDEWYKIKNGKVRRIKSLSRQAKQNAYDLRKFLRKHGCDQFVHGVVVLTNKDCKVDLINPSVPVLGVENLTKFIKNANTHLSQRKIHEIVGIIVARTKSLTQQHL